MDDHKKFIFNDNSNNKFILSNNIVDKKSVNTDDEKKCIVTIIDEDNITNINLNIFNKDTITFGRNENNDIKLNSLLVSGNHGYFKIDNSGVKVIDNNSTNGIFINNEKQNECYLKDGDSIKIDNPIEPLKRGIIFIVTLGNIVNKWNQCDLSFKDKINIGRSEDCDIVLKHVSISLHHATISNNGNNFIIKVNGNNDGVMLNGKLLNGQATLKERDVILIANAKLIYNKGRIIYQEYDKGVRLDAFDIVKTVKIKGKKKDISHHVDLSIKPGQFVSFVGGSGAGKTTFMKCISGISKPTSGKVLVDGNDLFSNYQTLKNIIGYVPQQDIVYTDLLLGDMLKYAANLRMPDDSSDEEKEKRIEEVLNIVELSDKKDVMIRNLSGGQRKRASIAVELIADPKLFFLDEPTSGLDPGTERSIMLTLRKMADSGKTIILVTHTTLNLHLCDKIVFFGPGGKLCFSGKPADALTFFNVNDFVDVYNLLSADTDLWYNKFNNSEYKEVVSFADTVENISKIKNRRSFFKQLSTLSIRYIKTIINNKKQLFLLLFQAPVIAYLISIVITENLFEYYTETKMIMFCLSVALVWIGLCNATQEICKERVILEKEHMANLKISSYLGSKVLVLMLLSLIQSILLMGTFVLFIDAPIDGVMFSWFLEMFLISFLTCFSSSMLGLTASAFANDTSVATSLAPLLLMPQITFSGVFFQLDGFKDTISKIILCRWSIEGLGITNDFNSLVTELQDVLPGYERKIENIFLFTSEHFINVIEIIILMSLMMIIICYLILKKQLESVR